MSTRTASSLRTMTRALGQVRHVHAPAAPGLDGRLVVVLAVYRGKRRITNAVELGDLRPEDAVEVAPILGDGTGRVRVAWLTFSVTPDMLGPAVGWFDGVVPDGVVRALPTNGG